MRTTGLVLDFYDDTDGGTIRSMFPDPRSIPGMIKGASGLTKEMMDTLPDDVFALVLQNGEDRLRKFACVDEGNTALSVLYFIKNAAKLPPEAQFVGAENLKVACAWYDLDVPEELGKIASVAGSLLRSAGGAALNNPLQAMALPSLVKGTGDNIGRNLDAIHQAGPAVGGMPDLRKQADVSGTDLMPQSAPLGKTPTPGQTVVKKTASGHLYPHVDVTGKEPYVRQVEKRASRYALPGRYPLDSYEQVKTAASYFEEYASEFEPEDRRRYCQSMVKRASELGIPMTPRARKYAGEKYASAGELAQAIDMRMQVMVDDQAKEVLSKVASQASQVDPLTFSALLGEFDKSYGIDRHYDQHIYDPIYSTYGIDKTAEDENDVETFSDMIGNLHVTGEALKTLSISKRHAVKSAFGKDLCEEFAKDPVGIYKSLPVSQKKMMINMANDNSPGSELRR